MTESEAEEVVAELLKSTDLESCLAAMSCLEEQEIEWLNRFHIVCWDAVTGDGADFP
jgi:hypothetical protein